MKMRRWEGVKMWRWEDEKMWRCEDEKMRRCEDKKMWRCENVWQTPTIRRTLRSDALGKKHGHVSYQHPIPYLWASTCRTQRCSDGQWEWAKLALQLLATIDVTMWHSCEPWTFQGRHTNIASGNWPCSLINIHRSMTQTYSTGLRSHSSVLCTKAATDCVKLQW